MSLESPSNYSDFESIVKGRAITVSYTKPSSKITSLKELFVQKIRGQYKSETLVALRNVDIEVRRGEAVALLGHNGSGKSTLLKVIAGIIDPPGADLQVTGRIAPMIELGAGFDPELSGVENIKLACMLMGLSKRETLNRLETIIDFSELREFIQMSLKNFSSGMQARLGFACATSVDPDLLLVDEVLSVGDSNFAKKCLGRIAALRSKGTTVILVSHDLPTVRAFCERGYVLDNGEVVFEGPIDAAVDRHRDIMDAKYRDTTTTGPAEVGTTDIDHTAINTRDSLASGANKGREVDILDSTS